MDITIVPVPLDEKETLRNLLEKYDYEFSQYNGRDVNKFGLYGYDYLDSYWIEEKRYPFFIKVDGNLAGFAMINDYVETDNNADYVMAEFFVMLKYRRSGVGKVAAYYLFDRFRGKWELRRHPKNLASVMFWNNVVDGYTGGDFILIEAHPDLTYEDGSHADLFLFDTSFSG